MKPHAIAVVALAALVPVDLYLLGVAGMPLAAAASTLCVLLIAAAVYVLFGGGESTASTA